MTKNLIAEREAAALLGLSAKTLQRWRWIKQGPKFVKLGGAVRYSIRDLEEFAGVPLGD
jgi:predicted DNA-binding transcriptional regulator AlpA